MPNLPEGVMSLRIMVVDDTLFMRQLLRGILEEEGWEVQQVKIAIRNILP